MKFKHVLVLALTLILFSFGLPQRLQKKVNKEIQKTFNVEVFDFDAIVIEDSIATQLPSKFGADNLFEIKTEAGLIGYAYIAKAPSKTDEFDYLVLLDTELIVKKAKVLIYREDYGSEIGSKRWLKQFIGKTQGDDLRYGDNVAAISGATISVRSMTIAMNNFLESLKILHSKAIL